MKKNAITSNLLSRIFEEKKASGLTYEQLSEATGLGVLAIRKMLTGQTSPRLENIEALASVFGLRFALVPKKLPQDQLDAVLRPSVGAEMSMTTKLLQGESS